ncbi:MAG TPA: hypothetical protein DCY88_29355 [Cyanobacteria bacterium UBA11372]|nr:hypothetical protein [Cyanobacteria bacterium UBA11372]
MSLSIRQWLAEYNIQLHQLKTPGAQTAGIAFRLVQDMQVKSLTTFDICPFAEMLELPWGVVRQEMQPIADLTVELLRVWSRKKPLKRNEGTWLAFQIAYLRGLHQILEQEDRLLRPWLNRASLLAQVPAELNKQALGDPQLQGLLKTLRPGRLSDTQAEQALTMLGESFLGQQMNNLAIAWLMANGAEETEAKLIVQRLVYALPGYLLEAIAFNALPLAQLQKFVRLGNIASTPDALGQIASNPDNLEIETERATEFAPAGLTPNVIDLQRECYRASLLQALGIPLLEEPFALKDLYVPLRGIEINSESGEKARSSVDLMEWATNQLADLESIAVIEAPPGAGKTSFCQLFAAKVAQELYPAWMPVSIRLRDASLCRSLEQTLDTAFPTGQFTSADGWLVPPHPPCLLILDGLDELPRSPQTERHLYTFLNRVEQFLIQSATASRRPRHKIVLTCRSGILEAAYSSKPLQPHSLSDRFRRIAIQPLDQEQLKLWFKQWSRLQSKLIAQAYFNFLKQSGVFHFRPDVKDFANFVHQPLIVLLGGILHRDGWLDDSILSLPGSKVKFEIHDRLCRWLLGEPADTMSAAEKMHLPVREGLAHACRSPETIANLLQGRNVASVRQQMEMVALNIIQSSEQSTETNPQEQITLPALYFRPISSDKQTKIEFSHRSLGEYLGALAIAQQLKILAQQVEDAYGEVNFAINSPDDVAFHLYSLLSFGIIPVEIEELAIEYLRREEARSPGSFSLEVLCDRLYRFYRSYCRGRWLDTGIAHKVRSHNSLNALQIDAAVGLNTFLLLCSCHRAALIDFSPCGDPTILEEFDPDQLLTLIGRTTVLSPIAFWQRSKDSLHQLSLDGACLHYAMLAEANFWKSSFFKAELVGANLTAANLQEANLSWANLTGANLSLANLTAAKLEGANLTGANLCGATLQLASLTNACLYQAQLDGATKDYAEKNGALFSLEQYQACQKALAGLESSRLSEIEESHDGDQTLLLIQHGQGSVVGATTTNSELMEGETVLLE